LTHLSGAGASVNDSRVRQLPEVVFEALPSTGETLGNGCRILIIIGGVSDRPVVEIILRHQMRLQQVLIGLVEIIELSLGGFVLESAPVGAGAHRHRRGGHPGVLGEQGAQVGAAVAEFHERHELVQETALGRHADREANLQPLVSGLLGALAGHGRQYLGLHFQRLVAERVANGESLEIRGFLNNQNI
jgi:hypothetical protein